MRTMFFLFLIACKLIKRIQIWKNKKMDISCLWHFQQKSHK